MNLKYLSAFLCIVINGILYSIQLNKTISYLIAIKIKWEKNADCNCALNTGIQSMSVSMISTV